MVVIDARLPVRFGSLETRSDGEAVVTDGHAIVAGPVARFVGEWPGHGRGCGCCAARSGAAAALAVLFRERAVEGPLFRGVLAVVGPDGERLVRAALAEDAVVSARFRLSREA